VPFPYGPEVPQISGKDGLCVLSIHRQCFIGECEGTEAGLFTVEIGTQKQLQPFRGVFDVYVLLRRCGGGLLCRPCWLIITRQRSAIPGNQLIPSRCADSHVILFCHSAFHVAACSTQPLQGGLHRGKSPILDMHRHRSLVRIDNRMCPCLS